MNNNNRKKKPIRRPPQPKPLRIPVPILKLTRESIFEAVSKTIDNLLHIKGRLEHLEQHDDKMVTQEIKSIDKLVAVLSDYQIPNIRFAGHSDYYNSLQAYQKEKQQQEQAATTKKLREYTAIKTVSSYH